jgi:DNA-binding transcriptional LysR family regulator
MFIAFYVQVQRFGSRSDMDKLKAMATFVAIVEHGSLSAAADVQNRSPASVVRTLADLESHLGVRLLNRSTRRIALTDEGQDYLLRCRRILAEVEEAEFLLDARKTTPSGRLAITAPVMFGRLHMAPLVSRWLAEHPGMSADLVLLDRVVDIIEEGFDLALRIGHLADSSLIAMPVGVSRSLICASPDLLKRLGQPQKPQDIAGWPAIVFGPQGKLWPFRQQSLEMSAVLTSNQIDVVLSAAISGLGVARVMSYQAQAAINAGLLIPLLVEHGMPPFPVQFVYPHNRLLSPRVRHFLDFAALELRVLLAAQEAGQQAG